MAKQAAYSKIVVVDYSWNGHLPTYHKYICKTLLQLGYEVHSISPNSTEVKEWLEAYAENYKLSCHSWDKTTATPASKQQETQQTTATKAYSKASVKQRLFNLVYSRPAIKKILDVHEMWKHIEKRIHEVVPGADEQSKVFVIVPYLDQKLLAPGYPNWLFRRAFKMSWAGIYFHPTFFRTGEDKPKRILNFFKADTCKAIAVLDEGIKWKMETIVGKPIVQFPDITNTVYDSSSPSELAQEIRNNAGERKIVSLLGLINNKKNVNTLLEAIKLSQKQNLPYYFVIAGYSNKYMWNKDDDFEAVCNELERYKSNTFSYFGQLNDGQAYNSLVAISDVLLASYKLFYHSSNTLTKAAFFKKPVIVSKGYLMEERVINYKLGIAINEHDAAQMLQAIGQVLKEDNGSRLYDEYYNLHTTQRLRQALSEMIK